MKLCKAGLHDLDDPANVYVKPSTGGRCCRVCKAERHRGWFAGIKVHTNFGERKLCARGHDLTDPTNVYARTDGYQCCRACVREGARQRHAANPERDRESRRQWRAANPERYREGQRRWREANPESGRERGRRWYEANQERRREQIGRWRAANPEQYAAIARRSDRKRKAALRGAPYTPEGAAYVEWIYATNPPCAYCGAPSDTIDHIVPVANGGTGDKANLAPACVSCNSAKGTLSATEFRRRLTWRVP
jgi:5-methylcytosine-specific restriction endonuclease McrA